MRNTCIIIIILAALVLGSCGEPKYGPKNQELIEELRKHIASNNGGAEAISSFNVVDFEVVTVENIGSKVKPDIQGRYIATLKTTLPLYTKSRQLKDGYGQTYQLIKESQPPGMVNNINGIYNSKLRSVGSDSKNWNTSFSVNINEDSKSWKGMPRPYFGGAIIEGSKDEAQLHDKISAIRAEFLKSLGGTWKTSKPLHHTGRGSAGRWSRSIFGKTLPYCGEETIGGVLTLEVDPELGFPQEVEIRAQIANYPKIGGKVKARFATHPVLNSVSLHVPAEISQYLKCETIKRSFATYRYKASYWPANDQVLSGGVTGSVMKLDNQKSYQHKLGTSFTRLDNERDKKRQAVLKTYKQTESQNIPKASSLAGTEQYEGTWEVFAYAPKGKAFNTPNWLEYMTIKSNRTYVTEGGNTGSWKKEENSNQLILTQGRSINTVTIEGEYLKLIDKSGGRYLYFKLGS